MTSTVTLLVGSLAIGLLLAPLSAYLLTQGRWQVWHPRAAIRLWALSGVTGLALTVLSVIATALLAYGAADSASPAVILALTLLAWFGVGGLGVAMSLASAGLGDDSAEEDPEVVAAAVGRPDATAPRIRSWTEDGTRIVEVEADWVVAHAVAGREPTIFIARHLRAALSPVHLSAVIAHEGAHLKGHHTLVRRLGAWHVACLPKNSRLRRGLMLRLHLLTELAADDAAARLVGRIHLAAALHEVNDLAPSSELRVRAARLEELATNEPMPRRVRATSRLLTARTHD